VPSRSSPAVGFATTEIRAFARLERPSRLPVVSPSAADLTEAGALPPKAKRSRLLPSSSVRLSRTVLAMSKVLIS